jgi:hypothetical protein
MKEQDDDEDYIVRSPVMEVRFISYHITEEHCVRLMKNADTDPSFSFLCSGITLWDTVCIGLALFCRLVLAVVTNPAESCTLSSNGHYCNSGHVQCEKVAEGSNKFQRVSSMV